MIFVVIQVLLMILESHLAIKIVIQRLKSTQFCEGTKIEFDNAVQLKKVHQPFTQLPMAQRIGSVPISVLEMT